jgi:hypothetical protein
VATENSVEAAAREEGDEVATENSVKVATENGVEAAAREEGNETADNGNADGTALLASHGRGRR